MTHQIMVQRGDFLISGIVAAGAGVVSIPALFRAGGGLRCVLHQVVTAVVTPSASFAHSQTVAGRVAAAAASSLNRVAVAALASAGVRVRAVVVRRPIVPVVTENAVFRAAFFTDFSCDAGGGLGAAGVFLTKPIMDFAVRAFIFYNDRMVL